VSHSRNVERLLALALLGTVSLVLALALAGRADAVGLADDANAEWQVEQPAPPPPEAAGVEPSSTPISLGRIGDIAFWEANRGALITAGNGSSIKPGVWFYNGVRWRELSNQCGATDGRIAWAGPDEFWTISDGRPGQAIVTGGERPPLEDNTLCHFAPAGPSNQIRIVASYASPPFIVSSYLAMHAAACLGPNDCWFGGDPLEEPQTGAFQLHWNGHSLEVAPFLPEGRAAEGHAAWDMVPFEGSLVESVRLLLSDRSVKPVPHPPVLHRINPEGSTRAFETIEGLPPVIYYEGEFPTALDYLHLSSADETLWAAGGPQIEATPGSEPAGVTVARKQAGAEWSQVIGPKAGQSLFGASAVLDSTGAEPGSSSAWVALDSRQNAISPNPLARARIARVNADGSISDEAELPAAEDPHGPLGAAQQIVCPAAHDCWLSTTDGWLAHLATAAERAHPNPDSDPDFAGEELLTFRPPDEGVPQEPSDELPADTSGLEEEKRLEEVIKPPKEEPAKVPVPLLTHVRSRLIHRTTLELSFHLAVKARVRLLAERRHHVVAKTASRTLKAGNRSLLLQLDPKRWPTKLNLQTHALAALPTQTVAAPNVNSVSTSFVATGPLLSGAGLFR
jgi:hypothetical protein